MEETELGRRTSKSGLPANTQELDGTGGSFSSKFLTMVNVRRILSLKMVLFLKRIILEKLEHCVQYQKLSQHRPVMGTLKIREKVVFGFQMRKLASQ